MSAVTSGTTTTHYVVEAPRGYSAEEIATLYRAGYDVVVIDIYKGVGTSANTGIRYTAEQSV